MQIIPLPFQKKPRCGFTLVELMIVISIILILATVTLLSVNFSYSQDRVRAAGRQLQSFIAGARDRAIYQKEIRGVRLILDPRNPHTAVAVQYVGSADRWADGSIIFDDRMRADRIVIPKAISLQDYGFLAVGSQIEIPKDSGYFYTIASVAIPVGSTKNGWVYLNRNCHVHTGVSDAQLSTFALTLEPSVIPNSEPVPLPSGIVIDLDGSSIPSSWRPPATNPTQSYSTTMDILFNPRGSVIGDVASNTYAPISSTFHLLLADSGDVISWGNIQGRGLGTWNLPVVPANLASGTPIVKRDQILVTVNGRTGNVSVHHVNPTNTSSNPIADDPYSLAETGQVSNQ